MAIKIVKPYSRKSRKKINLLLRLPLKAFCTNEKCWEPNEPTWLVNSEKCCERKVTLDDIYCNCGYALVWSREYREWK